MAFFVSDGVQVTDIAFGECDGLFEAGHATQSQCWTTTTR